MSDSFCYARLSFLDAPHISSIIKDYLSGNLPSDLYGYSPNNTGMLAQAKTRAAQFTHRDVLVKSLRRQYETCNSVIASKDVVLANIDALNKSNTLTVTTGHQACFGAGPLYSIYKIISTIVTAKSLSETDPHHNYVPVFWMATEDHDWEEANHFFIDGKKWTFDIPVEGCVGHSPTDGMEKWLETFASQLPAGAVSEEIMRHLKNAYVTHDNWADATRQWAHDLFAQYGLVVIDGDDKALKSLFIPVMERELFGEGFSEPLSKSKKLLSDVGYTEQAHPADVNLFFIGEGGRIYPKRTPNGFATEADSWTTEEFKVHLHKQPQHFSPNVILRPVYQECILPNVAYFGGPGELAYWLQLKSVFDAVNIPFPVLMLRHGFALMDNKSIKRYEKLQSDLLFLPPKEWKENWVRNHSSLRLTLEEEKDVIAGLFDQLETIAAKTDGSMIGAVNAQRAKQIKGMEKLEKKLLRAEKRHHSESMAHIDKLLNLLYPGKIPQERHDSLWMWWMKYGENPIPKIISSAKDGYFGVLNLMSEAN